MKMLNKSSTCKRSETTKGIPRIKADWSIDKLSKSPETLGKESWTWSTAMRFTGRTNSMTLILMLWRRRSLIFQTREEVGALGIPKLEWEMACKMRSWSLESKSSNHQRWSNLMEENIHQTKEFEKWAKEIPAALKKLTLKSWTTRTQSSNINKAISKTSQNKNYRLSLWWTV